MDLRDQIFGAQDLPKEEVFVPEWDVTVWVRGLTAAEKDDYHMGALVLAGDGTPVIEDGKAKLALDRLKDMRIKLVLYTTVDDKGGRIFSDDDAEKLGTKATGAIERLFEVASRLNRFSDSDAEELAGN